jgi:DNA-binding NarL/FixJ family response regulator
MDATPTVLVVEDDGGCRTLITDLLERAAFATLAAEDGERALELAARRRVDLALLDVELPRLSGFEVCRQLRARHGQRLPVMFLSGTRTDALDRAAGLMLGADDYVLKPFAPEELLARVHALLRRSRLDGNGSPLPLTRRELEVLDLLAEGRTQAEIAQELVLSPKTVGTHLERILRKLGVHSRAQAVAAAYRARLLEPH